jgi:hypothetical protein
MRARTPPRSVGWLPLECRRRMLVAPVAVGPGANLRLIADVVYCLLFASFVRFVAGGLAPS